MAPTRPLALLTIAVVFGSLAGCFGGSDDDGPGTSNPPEATADDVDDGASVGVGDGDNQTFSLEPAPMTLFLTADRKLSAEPQQPGAVAQGNWADEYGQGTWDTGDYAWTSEPLLMPAKVAHGTVTMTLWIESDAPITPLGYGGSFVTVGFGSGKGKPIYGGTPGPSGPLPPRTPTRFDLTFDFASPLAEVVVPVGHSFAFFALTATTADQTPIRVLVGGDHASAIAFTHGLLAADPLANATATTTETASGAFDSEGAPNQHAFAVAPDAAFVEVTLRPTSGAQALDIDLELATAGGEVVSHSLSPTAFEGMYLAGPALDALRGTDATVRVLRAFGGPSAYELTITQG